MIHLNRPNLRFDTRAIAFAAALLTGLLTVNTAPAADRPAAPAEAGQPYIRRAAPEARSVALEVVVRTFEPIEGDGPPIALVSAVHVGSAEYYAALQRFLDSQDVVLFEGVGQPSFAEAEPPKDDAQRIRRTRDAVRFTATMIEQYRVRRGGYPPSLDILAQELETTTGRNTRLYRLARVDAWGRPLHYQPDKTRFTLRSHGADGKPGGDGPDADLDFADQPPLAEHERSDDAGIQGDLAAALGLVFQLDGINYDREHFVHSDMSVAELMARLQGRKPAADDDDHAGGEQTVDTNQFLQALGGGSAMVMNVLKGMLGLMQQSPRLQHMAKALMIEMLGEIEGDPSRLGGSLPPQMARMMKVIVDERNQTVIDDLKAQLARPDKPKSIAVFYGAAHYPDLEARLADQCRYKPASEFWLTAFDANLDQAGLSDEMLETLRGTIKAQLKMMQNAPKRPGR